MLSAYAKTPFTVMLIDDSETDRFLHSLIIEKAQLAKDILTYEDGVSALDYLQVHGKEMDKLPVLILLDLNMPIMDGFKFLEEFEHFPDDIKQKCKIVILSSSENVNDIDKATNNKNVRKYCVKPLTEETVETIKQIL